MVGFASIDGASGVPIADVQQVNFSVTANHYDVFIGLSVGQISLSGTATGTAHLGDISADLDVTSLFAQGTIRGNNWRFRAGHRAY